MPMATAVGLWTARNSSGASRNRAWASHDENSTLSSVSRTERRISANQNAKPCWTVFICTCQFTLQNGKLKLGSVRGLFGVQETGGTAS